MDTTWKLDRTRKLSFGWGLAPISLSASQRDCAILQRERWPPILHDNDQGKWGLRTLHSFPAVSPRSTLSNFINNPGQPAIPEITEEQYLHARRHPDEWAGQLPQYAHESYNQGDFHLWDEAPASDAPVRSIIVERLRPRNYDPDGLVLFAIPALSMIKDTIVPFLEAICESAPICEIIVMDMLGHGATSIANRHRTDNDIVGAYDSPVHWNDVVRDALSFLSFYLPPTTHAYPPSGSTLPFIDPRNRQAPWRKVVGLGHSASACIIQQAVVHVPELFRSLVVIEPITATPEMRKAVVWPDIVPFTLKRTDFVQTWAEVSRVIERDKLTKKWDPQVKELFLRHGWSEVPATRHSPAGIKRTCDKYVHAKSFLAISTFSQISQSLHCITVPTLWVVSDPEGRKVFYMPPEENLRLSRLIPDCTFRKFDSGHEMVQQNPDELGRLVADYLVERFSTARPSSRL